MWCFRANSFRSSRHGALLLFSPFFSLFQTNQEERTTYPHTSGRVPVKTRRDLFRTLMNKSSWTLQVEHRHTLIWKSLVYPCVDNAAESCAFFSPLWQETEIRMSLRSCVELLVPVLSILQKEDSLSFVKPDSTPGFQLEANRSVEESRRWQAHMECFCVRACTFRESPMCELCERVYDYWHAPVI